MVAVFRMTKAPDPSPKARLRPKRFDVVDYLIDEARMVEYLAAMGEEGGESLRQLALDDVARARRAVATASAFVSCRLAL